MSGGTAGKGIVTGETVISAGEGVLAASLRIDASRVIDWRDDSVLPEWVGLKGRDGSGRNGLG